LRCVPLQGVQDRAAVHLAGALLCATTMRSAVAIPPCSKRVNSRDRLACGPRHPPPALPGCSKNPAPR
jgi:hypothetical protein